ncbi:MAG TPA: NosD domain-containing protein [Clostridia bacterium]|nr:NosD domain-containing protein [Clostridia bacterium]
MLFKRIILSVLILALITFSFSAEYSLYASESVPELSMKLVGQIGGPIKCVAVNGSYAYIGAGLSLNAIDISSQNAFSKIGSSEVLGGLVEDVVVSGGMAFVAAGEAGVYIMDLSVPEKPKIIGTYDTAGFAERIALSRDFAYVADGPSGLSIIDIADAKNLKEVCCIYSQNYIYDVVLKDNHVYLAAAGAGILAADISDPIHPKAAGYLDTPGYAFGIAVSGNTVCIADGWDGMITADITNPNEIKQVGSYKTPGWAFDVFISGNIAYVADAYKGLRAIDITDRTKPVETGYYEVSGGDAHSLAAENGVVYIADRNTGLNAVDMSLPGKAVLKGQYNPLGFADDVTIEGNHAYVATGTYGGLCILDISDPDLPKEMGEYITGDSYTTGIVSAGKFAYMITNLSNPSGLYTVEVSDPDKPAGIGFCEIPGAPQDIVVKDGIAYVVNEWGLYIIDITDPISPARLGYLDFAAGDDAKAAQATWGVAVEGHYAYVTHSQYGVKIVDVTDPRNPLIISEYKHGAFRKLISAAIKDGVLYVSDHPDVHVINVKKPQSPVYTGSFKLPEKAERITCAGSLILSADGTYGMQLLDSGKPFNQLPEASGSSQGYAYGLAVSGNHIYVSCGYGGIQIYEIMSGIGPDSQKSTGRTLEYQKQYSGDKLVYEEDIRNKKMQNKFTSKEEGPGDKKEMTGIRVDNTKPVGSGKVLNVTATGDSGPGTLRQMLESAESGDVITFDPAVFPARKPVTVLPDTTLPPLEQGNITIDAGSSGVILDGSRSKDGGDGLCIRSDGNIIKGLQIINFRSSGISIEGRNNIIGGDRTKGNAPTGEGNLISCNGIGIDIRGPGALKNKIIGNLVGTDAGGKAVPGKQRDGILIHYGASRNIVGGKTTGERNIVSGNESTGIILADAGTEFNKITGNYIGTDIDGIYALGQVSAGVFIHSGATRNTVGGTSPEDRNVISGNKRAEVSIMSGANNNEVTGNYLGIDAAGKNPIGPSVMGLSIECGGIGNTISKNVINGGIMISDARSNFNRVTGNFVGTTEDGSIVFNTPKDGVSLNASLNAVGGSGKDEGNVIYGNNGCGISVGFTETIDNIILGNLIGISRDGKAVQGNASDGIWLKEGASHTIIGGATASEMNIIGGNKNGIKLGSGVKNSFIIGNCIGTDESYKAVFANSGDGIQIEGSDNNLVRDNYIGHNNNSQITIKSGSSNRLYRNRIDGNPGGKGKDTDNGSGSLWDNGKEGNYWSGYKGKDTNKDGIGDMPYKIDSKGVDRYPLMTAPALPSQKHE